MPDYGDCHHNRKDTHYGGKKEQPIAYNGANYKIPKSAVPADLTVEECKKLIEEQGEKKPARRSRATAKSTDTAEKKSTAKKSTAKKTTSAKSTTKKAK